MKFAVYQIQFTEEQVQSINRNLPVPAFEAKTTMQLNFKGSNAATAEAAMESGFYTHVANIEAESFDGVFEVGNIGPAESIERLTRMSSISVGDVIVDEEGSTVVVDAYGFTLFGFRPQLASKGDLI